MTAKPNFLYIMTDQHRADHTGFGGNNLLSTPNLDAIASAGIVFDRAYVSNPICMPNRSTIMTGRMPSAHGTRHNGISLNWHSNTFIKALRKAGYRTTHIGKSHLQNMGVNKQGMLRDVDFTLPDEAFDLGLAEGWDNLENLYRYKKLTEVEIPDDFYGYERADFVVSHADICGGHYYQWLLRQGINPEEYQGYLNALQQPCDWSQIYQTRLPTELYPTTYIGDQSIREIEQARKDDRPFFIHCSFPDPHHPFTPPGKYFDMYSADDIILPDSFNQDHSKSMPHIQEMLKHRGKSARVNTAAWSPVENQLRHAAAAEYGMIGLIDDTVGRIMQALDANGEKENTIIIFNSDHGDMFGDHGLMLKHELHYEGCIRVPLVISLPDSKPGRTNSLVSSIDLAQTILDLADVEPYYGMQGVSLCPLLNDPSLTLRDSVLIEEDEKNDPFGLGFPLRMRTLVNHKARITIYQGMNQGELFDLYNDPLELNNLWFDTEAAQLKSEMMEVLNQQMMRVADLSPRPIYSA